MHQTIEQTQSEEKVNSSSGQKSEDIINTDGMNSPISYQPNMSLSPPSLSSSRHPSLQHVVAAPKPTISWRSAKRRNQRRRQAEYDTHPRDQHWRHCKRQRDRRRAQWHDDGAFGARSCFPTAEQLAATRDVTADAGATTVHRLMWTVLVRVRTAQGGPTITPVANASSPFGSCHRRDGCFALKLRHRREGCLAPRLGHHRDGCFTVWLGHQRAGRTRHGGCC